MSFKYPYRNLDKPVQAMLTKRDSEDARIRKESEKRMIEMEKAVKQEDSRKE